MYLTAAEVKEDEHRFFAAIQGVEYGDDEGESKADEVIRRAQIKAQAMAAGKSEEEIELDGLFQFVDEE